MRRRGGDTLVEVLVSLLILALVLPSLFSALGVGLLGSSGLRAADDRLYGAQWWSIACSVRCGSLCSPPCPAAFPGEDWTSPGAHGRGPTERSG